MTNTADLGPGYPTSAGSPAGSYATGEYLPSYSAPSYAPPVLPDPQSGSAGEAASPDETSTTDVAKDQAASVAGGAADAAQHVAGVAKEQVGQVTAEAGRQVKHLLGQARSELSDQAEAQQQRTAAGLHSVGDQLKSMAQGSEQPGMATDLAHQAADKAHQLAGWLENRDPGSVLDEVRRFAKQRPGVFLAAALGAGLLAGRLARGLAADPDDSADQAKSASPSGYPAPSSVTGTRPAAVGYRGTAAELPAGLGELR